MGCAWGFFACHEVAGGAAGGSYHLCGSSQRNDGLTNSEFFLSPCLALGSRSAGYSPSHFSAPKSARLRGFKAVCFTKPPAQGGCFGSPGSPTSAAVATAQATPIGGAAGSDTRPESPRSATADRRCPGCDSNPGSEAASDSVSAVSGRRCR